MSSRERLCFYLWPQMWASNSHYRCHATAVRQVTAHTIPEDCAAWQCCWTQANSGRMEWPQAVATTWALPLPPQAHSSCNCWIPSPGQTEQVSPNGATASPPSVWEGNWRATHGQRGPKLKLSTVAVWSKKDNCDTEKVHKFSNYI